MKRSFTVYILIFALMLSLTACYEDNITEPAAKDNPGKNITVGFSQLGAESEWRNANTRSMQETFTGENGYNLILENGQQKQSNQIMAIRTFIQQEVDYIVLAPVTEEGWDTVLQEAKDAGIPVIIVDRMVNVSDLELFKCFVGSDFLLESKKVTTWMNDFFSKKGIDPRSVNVVDLQGNLGASAQLGRSTGLSAAAREYKWHLLAKSPGDFTQAKGKEVMQGFLAMYDNINVVYCENDDMALGAIEAIEEAGLKPGSDIENGEIMIVSFDGVNEQALQYVMEDKISCIGECNPLHGPRIDEIIKRLDDGKTPEKLQYVDESIYVHDNTVENIILDKKSYEVIEMTEDIIYNKRLEFGN